MGSWTRFWNGPSDLDITKTRADCENMRRVKAKKEDGKEAKP